MQVRACVASLTEARVSGGTTEVHGLDLTSGYIPGLVGEGVTHASPSSLRGSAARQTLREPYAQSASCPLRPFVTHEGEFLPRHLLVARIYACAKGEDEA